MRRHPLLFVLLLASAAARADCTDGDRADMIQMGLADKDIAAICDTDPQAGPPASVGRAYYCATANGYCPLPDAESPGLSCSCDTAYGPVAGKTE